MDHNIVNADSMRSALCSGISCFGTQFSEQLFHDNSVQQGVGYLQELTVGTADDEFRSALCSVYPKTLKHFTVSRELE